jgi:hypothetical protein
MQVENLRHFSHKLCSTASGSIAKLAGEDGQIEIYCLDFKQ